MIPNNKTNNPNPTLTKSVFSIAKQFENKLLEKKSAIVVSFFPDYFGYVFMNNFYKGNNLTQALAHIKSPFTVGVSFLEHVVHRSCKVVGGLTSMELLYDQNSMVRTTASTATVGTLEFCLASPLYRVATQAQVGLLNPSTFKTIFNSNYGFYKGAGAYALRGTAFSFPQFMSQDFFEKQVFHKQLKDMDLFQQIITISANVVAGSIGAAVPTWVNVVASAQDLPAKQALAQLIKTPMAPFNLKAISSKIVFKTPAHLIQYSTFFTLVNLTNFLNSPDSKK